MPRQFLVNLSFLIFLNLIVKPFYILGIEVSVQNAVGADTYGIFFALLNSAYLFQIINDFGIQIYHNRQVARDAGALHRLFGGLLQLKVLFAGVFVVLVLVFTVVAGYVQWVVLTLGVVANLVLMSFVLFLRSGISGLGQYRTDSVLSILDKLLMILICGALLLTLSDFTIYHFVYAQMASLVVTASVAFAILRKRHMLRIYRLGLDQLRMLIRQAGPYALAVFLMSIYTRVDGVMIEQLAVDGPYQAGLYAAGYRLLDAANMIAFLFAVLLLPMFSKLMDDQTSLRSLLSQSSRLMWTLTVSLSVLCFFFRQPLMQLLYAESTVGWGDVFGLLILSFNGIGMMYIFGTLITAKGDLRILNVLYACFAFLNIGMNAVLIPKHGAWGAAIATLITQSLVAVALVITVNYSVQWQWPALSWLRRLLFAAGVTGISYASLALSASYSWIICFAVAVLCIGVYAFVIRMLHVNELMVFFRRTTTPH